MPVSVELDEQSKHIFITADWRFKELCKSLPGSTYDSKVQLWKVPVSWGTCLALRSTFKEDLVIGPLLASWAANERTLRVDPSNALRDLEELPEGEGDEDLFPHQRAGVKFLSTAKRALLADEPGLGKTAQAIRALKKIQDDGGEPFPALIICPNTLKKNWKREFAKWWPGVKVQVITGTATQRRKQFDEEADVYVINWESLRSHSRLAPYGSVALARCPQCKGMDDRVTENRCEVHERELNRIDFKAVVADEIHRSKDPKSKQTRAMWAATGDADYRFALTGTPIARDVLDMWPILHWLSPEEWPSKTRWIDRMVDTMLNAFGGMMVLGVKPHMEAEFHASINPRMRRMLKARVLPWLPDMVFERRDIEMSTKQAKAYKDMRDNMIAELESGEAVIASSVLTQTTRLTQFASAFAEMVTDEATGEIRPILSEPSCKVDAVMDDIKSGDFGDDSVAVCAVSRQLINLLSASLTKEGIEHGLITGAQSEEERQKAVDDFQAGKIKWILFTAQAGGVGITLTAARRLIMLQRPWSLVDFEQIVKDKDKLLALLKDDKAGKL